MISLLLRTRLRTLFNIFKDSKKTRLSVFIISALVLFGVVVAGFLSEMFSVAVSNREMGAKLIESMAALTAHIVFLVMFFYGLSYAVYAVFFGKDLELLFSIPVRERDIFIFKVIEAAFFNFRISIVIAMPAMVVMGIFYNAGPFYYFFVPALILILTAIPGSLGIIVASWIAKRVSRSRIRNALTVVGALLGLVVWAGFNMLSRSFSGDFSGGGAGSIISYATNRIWSYLPSGWVSTAAISMAKNEWPNFLLFFGLIAACAISLTFFAFKSIKWYFKEGVIEEYSRPVESRLFSFGGGGSPLWAHMRRDIIIIFREINALAQSLILIIFFAIFPFFAGFGAGDEPFPLSIPPTSLVFANILGCQIGSRLIPLEKLGFWLNIAAPFGSRYLILSKTIVGFTFGFVISLVVGAIHLISGITTEISYIPLLVGFFWAGFGAGMAFSIYFSDFGWENPNKMLKIGGVFLYIFSIIGISLPLGVAAYMAGEVFPGIIDPGLLVVMLSLCMVSLSLLITHNKLSNYEWDVEV